MKRDLLNEYLQTGSCFNNFIWRRRHADALPFDIIHFLDLGILYGMAPEPDFSKLGYSGKRNRRRMDL